MQRTDTGYGPSEGTAGAMIHCLEVITHNDPQLYEDKTIPESDVKKFWSLVDKFSEGGEA